MINPPVWSKEQLELALTTSTEHFRTGRGTEPLEAYLQFFDEYRGVVEEFMELTVDLTELSQNASEILSDTKMREVFRYVTGPPVSEDDLKTLVGAKRISSKQLAKDPGLITAIIEFVQDWHDRRRFPWLAENWLPEEHTRDAAILATSALLAMRRLETLRRSAGKELQELLVLDNLVKAGLKQVGTRRVATLAQAPKPGEFCRESILGTRKADFIIGLWDQRTIAVECKVSNSATNSVKRLNNDAAAKAEVWRRDFGQVQVVPCAVLGGVYSINNLEDAQNRGLTLFWAHDLQQMVDWILQTK